MRYLSCLVLSFSLFCSMANGLTLKIDQPKDKATTYQDVITLSGVGVDLKALSVNDIPLEIKDDGSFSCGLVLSPGKNFVEVNSWGNEGNFQKKSLKILHLVSYPDVNEHWAKYEIITLATLGIIEGYPDGNFYLSQGVTRGELATWFARAKGLKIFPLYQDVAQDVPKEQWRAQYIKAVIDNKLMSNLSPGLFRIDDYVTRGEAARIAIEAEGKEFLPEIGELFYDVPKNHPFYSEIKKAKESGLTKGISRRFPIYQPDREISRAECAILLSRFSRVKWLEKWLYDFSQGYSSKTFAKINTPPRVLEANIYPQTFSVFDENIVLTLAGKVEDRQGLQDILNVKGDISGLGGPPDAELRDDGEKGDGQKGDGIYTLQFTPTVESWGERVITVTATDKAGWTGSNQTSVTVVR